MRILHADNYESLSRKAASIIGGQVLLKPNCVLGLATGSSPIGTYNALIDTYKKGDLDFSKCHTVNLDEYVGLTADNEQSYAYFMNKNLFSSININMENTHVPNGMNFDAEKECDSYNKLIEDLGGVDIQLLGIGHNGHIGFNEPCDEFVPLTHCVELTKTTIDANTRFFEKREDVPTKAYTMGIKNIMCAKKVLLIATGEDKSEIINTMVTGKVEPNVPASILQLHPDVTIIADDKALSLLAKNSPELISK